MHKKAKRGSGGILLYISDRVRNYTEIQDKFNTEDRLWIRIGTADVDGGNLFCYFCYMAPSNSVVMCNSESQWETLEAEVVEYVSKGRVLICGDLNARTGEGKDFIDNDAPVPIDFHAYLPDKELPRVSKDKYTNYQ